MYSTQTSSLISHNSYLIALLESHQIAFTTDIVQNILTIEHSQILVLPFYNSACIGVINYQNEIIPLVSTKTILGTSRSKNIILPSLLTIIRLNNLAEHLAGIGLVVDRMGKKIAGRDISQEHIFQVADIPPEIWQPLR